MSGGFICYECGMLLTAEERYYYAGRCETCEREWHDEINRWRAGEDNPKLDAMFSAPKPTEH